MTVSFILCEKENGRICVEPSDITPFITAAPASAPLVAAMSLAAAPASAPIVATVSRALLSRRLHALSNAAIIAKTWFIQGQNDQIRIDKRNHLVYICTSRLFFASL
ncbi:hypothetical protein [Paenibacillus hamazuiensis]|uniref:hypothetical protein n=1 Tax=Paenibacillus hamazuiensis TaxID=2936508 RepID=UPI00200CB807|nr:hypothetical protein [Paenibacillus hamazuiensis]